MSRAVERAPARRSLRLSGVAALSAVVIVLVAWLAVGAVLRANWQGEVASELRQNENLSTALTEQTVRVFATIDQAMIRVQHDFAAAAPRQPDLARYANETGLVPNILVQLTLIDAAGRLVSSNLDPDGTRTNHVDLSEREHVRVQLHPELLAPGFLRPAAGSMYVGKPVIGKVSGRWTIQLSRKIVDAAGLTRGVIVASLDPTYFEDVYRRVSLGRDGGVALVGADLNVRARVIGGASRGMGTSVRSGSAFDKAIESAREGHFVAPSGIDGVQRIAAFRRVSDYPLYLAVSTSQDEALASWRSTRDVMLVLTALLSVVVIVAAINFSSGLRRLELGNDALRASEAKANAANQAKTEFLCAMSHELRTPLTSIRGFAELMEHRLEQPGFKAQAGLIRKSAEYLNRLLTEILDMSKIDAGGVELAPEPLDVRALAAETCEFFALSAQEKGLTLSTRVEPDVPVTFVCDGLRLKQILNNLLSNAVKFTGSGGVVVTVSTHGRQLRFDIEDTGPGVPLDMQEAIFEKFRQGDARVSYQHGGTGLGLALSRGLAGLLNGTLCLRSTPGHGACFSLSLPLDALSGSSPARRALASTGDDAPGGTGGGGSLAPAPAPAPATAAPAARVVA